MKMTELLPLKVYPFTLSTLGLTVMGLRLRFEGVWVHTCEYPPLFFKRRHLCDFLFATLRVEILLKWGLF